MAGVPFESVERLSTPAVFARARDLVGRRDELAETIAVAETFFASGEHLLSRQEFRAFRSAVRARRAPLPSATPQPDVVTDYAAAAAHVAAAELQLGVALESALAPARRALVEEARKYLRRQSIFNSAGVRELLEGVAAPTPLNGAAARRNCHGRERERHLLLYLQRVCAKNDSFSEFGPTSWGKADLETAGISLEAPVGITARETFMERWTAHAIAAALNADPAVFPELRPRLHPNGRLNGEGFVFAESGEHVTLTDEELATVKACDGKTPAHEFAHAEILRNLVSRKIIRCEAEVPALEPHALETLRDDVLGWRAGETRERWLTILEPLAGLPGRFAATSDIADREALLEEARSQFRALGIERKSGERHLYAALNPIGEECFRDTAFRIDPALINEVAVDGAPWIDLWRDSYAFVASRVAAGLRSVFAQIPSANDAVPLPAFLRACEASRLPLGGPGLVVLAHVAFQEVKAAFREMIAPHRAKAEYELTAEDCAFVRRRFDYPKFDEYTYPSADLQLAARSSEAVARGEYQWILAELHPPAALLHHGAYWSCPDKEALHRAFAQTIGDRPSFHFGFFAADFTAHTAIRIFDALPDRSNFVAPQRGNAAWRTVAPADAEVFVDEATGDVGVRAIGSGEYLGSFARAWVIPLGFHPFQFGMPPHMPRLRCGRVIVQRRAWTITQDELGPGDFTGVSRDLVLAIERLRSEKEWPRHVYIRPTEQALRRSGVEGRDKDTKPIYIDFESYLFLEVFHHWLTKAGELEVTEMLPDPGDLCWQEPDGRRTFELRTLIVPRAS